MWRVIGAGLGVIAFAALVAGALWRAYDLGREAGTARAEVTLANWKASVIEQASERRQAQRARYDALQGELDELRSRPERVRTVTRTIRLKPDAECSSLSADYRRLWDAGYESGVRMGAATATAGLDHAGRVALADAERAIDEAKYRLEFNAVRLTGAQEYIRQVCRPE